MALHGVRLAYAFWGLLFDDLIFIANGISQFFLLPILRIFNTSGINFFVTILFGVENYFHSFIGRRRRPHWKFISDLDLWKLERIFFFKFICSIKISIDVLFFYSRRRWQCIMVCCLSRGTFPFLAYKQTIMNEWLFESTSMLNWD